MIIFLRIVDNADSLSNELDSVLGFPDSCLPPNYVYSPLS